MGRKREVTESQLFLIHRLVQAGMKIRAACRQVALSYGWPDWKLKRFEETARKNYAERRDAGTLPAELPVDPRYEDAIRKAFHDRELLRQDAQRQIEAFEASAASLDLDLEAMTDEKLAEMKQEELALEDFLSAAPRRVADQLRREERTPEAAIERLQKAQRRLEFLRARLQVIEGHSWARHTLAMIDAEQISPKFGEKSGSGGEKPS